MWKFQPRANNRFQVGYAYCEFNQNNGNRGLNYQEFRANSYETNYFSAQSNIDFTEDYDENNLTNEDGSGGFVQSKEVMPYRQIVNDRYQEPNRPYAQQNLNNNDYGSDNYYGGGNGNYSGDQYNTEQHNRYNHGNYNGFQRAPVHRGVRERAGYVLLGRNFSRNDYQAPYDRNAYERRNYQTYRDARTIKCYTCGESFCNKRDLFAHRREAHSTKNFYCSVCTKQFNAFKLMKKHEETHTIQACSECPEVFKFKESLMAHKEHAHPTQSTHEEPSNKSFGNLSDPVAFSTPAGSFTSYSQDSGVHVKHEIFPCARCIKTFDSEDKLQSHLVIHTDVKPNSQTQSISDLQSTDSFSCPFCIKKFTSRRNLTLHIDSAHTKVFYCGKCTAEFTAQSDLDEHSKIHLNRN